MSNHMLGENVSQNVQGLTQKHQLE